MPKKRNEWTIHISTSSGCWEWTGVTKETGYGRIWTGSRYTPAHRHYYEKSRGPIPGGLEIDHLCRNRACVNPWHLEPVTHRENSLRSNNLGGRHSRATHCKQGHPFDTFNTIRARRQRVCRTCKNANRRRRRSFLRTAREATTEAA